MMQVRQLGPTTNNAPRPRTKGLWQALVAVSSLAAVLAGCGAPPEATGDTVADEDNLEVAGSIDREGRSPAVIDREGRSPAVIDREGRSPAVIDRPGRSHTPVRNAAGGTMLYFGGPVVPNPKVYAVWWGDPARLNPAITAAHGGIADFFTGITNSNFIDWMNEYDTNITVQAGSHAGQPGTNQHIGRGNYAGAITLTNIPAGNVTDGQVQGAINTAIAAKVLPTPDANTIYAIYFPSSVTISLPGAGSSCLSFGAYHEVVAESGMPNAYYLIMPDCGYSFAGTTIVTSHELIEATTDGEPTPGSNPDYPQAWNDAQGSETADLCEGTSGSVTTPLGTFQVQGIWDERSQGCKVITNAAQDFNAALSPNTATLAVGGNGTFTVQTATTAGAAEALTLTVAAPAGVTASVTPTSITSGQTATLSVSASSAAANVQVVVSAAGAAGTHTAALLLNVSGSGTNDFSLAITPPTSQTVASGSSAIHVTYPITTAVTAGMPESVGLSIAGLTGGVTGAFNPATVTSGGGSTLTLTVPAQAAASVSNFTVTGTAASGTHAAAGTLTVTSSSGGAVINGGFETGDLTGWTASGASTSVVSGGHSGSFAARLGNTTPTKGNSTLVQTLTVPTGATKLSLWYKMTCPDNVLDDFATARVKDNVSGKTTTIVARTCVTNSWTQASATVTAGHSVTLTLISHDNNKSGTVSYTLYDDVAVQ